LPGLMQQSAQRASRLGSETINRVEAALLSPLIGSVVEATVVAVHEGRATIQLADPAVTASAPVPASSTPGSTVSLRIAGADITRGEVEFVPV